MSKTGIHMERKEEIQRSMEKNRQEGIHTFTVCFCGKGLYRSAYATKCNNCYETELKHIDNFIKARGKREYNTLPYIITIISEIVVKLCTYVDADPKTINFIDDEWFMQYSWTTNDEEDFKKWLLKKVKNSEEWRVELLRDRSMKKTKYLKKFTEEFVMNYGWKIRNE